MGYFPNGSAWSDYEDKYCWQCKHDPHEDGEMGCPIQMAHFLYAYGATGKLEECLDLFIPRTKDKLGNEQCRMFSEAPLELNHVDECDGCKARPKDAGNHHRQDCPRWTL